MNRRLYNNQFVVETAIYRVFVFLPQGFKDKSIAEVTPAMSYMEIVV
ncbi:hypothetical protein HUN01_05695 [Nostoc edaphicum CCNP1411]|uniref:Uncharacterized protein n=1 Tax=Nostoc edaphicum CCNP1411 TaxID=1472755 RepID=A0A7D7LAT2_9NOSO|nr:hypothetical protein [Nostoc edaphicum]QMS87094.1 hypothetical protein HUN01_05695 [Nostoc edaphicum CCNP1411]